MKKLQPVALDIMAWSLTITCLIHRDFIFGLFVSKEVLKS